MSIRRIAPQSPSLNLNPNYSNIRICGCGMEDLAIVTSNKWISRTKEAKWENKT